MQSTHLPQKKEKKAEESKLGMVASKTESKGAEQNAAEAAQKQAAEETSRILDGAIATLEGRLQPDPLDDTFLILQGREPPLISKEFLKFEKGVEIIPLPPKETSFREDLDYYAKQNQALFEKMEAGEKTKEQPSFIDIRIIEGRNIAIITNTAFLPPKVKKKASKLASALKKIQSSGNEESLLTAHACWEELKFSVEGQSSYAVLAEQALSQGKPEFSDINLEISKTYGEIAQEMFARIGSLAKGEGVSQASILATTPMQKRLTQLQTKAATMQMEEATGKLTGMQAIEKIERGIELGLYSNIEIVMYKQIAGELKATLGRIKGFSKRGMEQISIEGYDGLSGWQQKSVEHAIGLVAHLECIAWKVDVKDRTRALKSRMPTVPVGMLRPITSQHIPMSQLTHRSRAEMRLIAKRAKEHVSYLKSFLNNADDLTDKEKEAYAAKLDKMSKDVSGMMLPGEFSTVSKELATLLEGAEQVLGERHLERVAEDEDNPWNVRTSAYIKMYVLRHSLEIIGVSAVAGGVVGGVATRNPAGAWVGVKAGAAVGSLIVAAAGAFLTADAMHRYFSGSGDLEQAVEDMRTGATYFMFGLVGAPIAAISTPVKLIVGGGVALTSGILMYHDIKNGNYWEIPADVAYIAIGSIAFLRVAGGLFRAVRLSQPLKSTMVIANSSGVARVALKAKDKLVSISTSAYKVGYTPGWIALNTVFGGFSQWNNISTAIDNGNYGMALSYLNRGFAEVTRGMVGFDFALFGVAGSVAKVSAKMAWRGAKAGVRYFRVTVPAAEARVVNFLGSTGLYERVAGLAQKAGANTFSAKTNAQVLELAFASEGKVTAETVQATLGVGSRASAAKIATEINTSWSFARRLLAKGKNAGAAAWRKAGRMMERASKTRAARLAGAGAKGAALIGVVGYMEYEHAEETKLAGEINHLITKQEAQFVNYLLAAPRADFGTCQLESKTVVHAMGVVNSISDDVDDGVHPLALQLELGGDIEKRKRFLLSGALALLMEGHQVTDENLSSIVSGMNEVFANTDAELDVHTPISTLAFMGSIVLQEGPDGLVEAYDSMSVSVHADERFAFLDYAVSSYYCAAALGRSTDWAADVSFSVFRTFVENGMEGKIQGWGLALTFQRLEDRAPAEDEVISTAQVARWNNISGGFAVEE